MAKRKGFNSPVANLPEDESIYVQAMVGSRDYIPAVQIQWGKQGGILDPKQARDHAYAVLEAIAAAEIDSCLVRWLIQALKVSPQEATQILHLFRQKRDNSELPSVTMNMGNGDHIRPETARLRATRLFNAAFGVEVEAFLAVFLLQDLNANAEAVDLLIQELREMRGAVTAWDGLEGGDRP